MAAQEPTRAFSPAADRTLPDDVRAEIERDQGWEDASSLAPMGDFVPEDVLAERYADARSAEDELWEYHTEGSPPAEDEPRS